MCHNNLTQEYRMHNKKNQDNYHLLFQDYPDIVNVEQMSEMLHISQKTAYRLLKDHKIEALLIGRNYKIPKVNIIKYLNL